MGTKNAKGSISIEQKDNRIRLRWRFLTKRFSLNLFHFSETNLIKAKKIALDIEHDILAEKFDATLQRYKPVITSETPAPKISLIAHFEYWVKEYRNMSCETDVDYHSTRNMMKRWGNFSEAKMLSHLNKETFSAKTYNRRLTLLKSFLKWALKHRIVNENPLEDVLPKKTRRSEKADRKPFTEDEIRRILMAVKNNTYCPNSSRFKHSYYYPFLYFMFKTGVRNSEAIGLRVKDLDFSDNTLCISEALTRSLKGTNAAARSRKDTKNRKQRVLPFTKDLKDILSPLVQNRKPDDLVFISQKGVAVDDRMFQKRVFSKVLKELKIPHRVLYACRHTFNSRCIDAGMTPVATAFLMGNNPETALRNYTHQLGVPTELPDIL